MTLYDIVFGLSSLVIIYGTITIIAVTIRAALRAKKMHPSAGGHPLSQASPLDEKTGDPYYQPICHHSRPLHLAK